MHTFDPSTIDLNLYSIYGMIKDITLFRTKGKQNTVKERTTATAGKDKLLHKKINTEPDRPLQSHSVTDCGSRGC